MQLEIKHSYECDEYWDEVSQGELCRVFSFVLIWLLLLDLSTLPYCGDSVKVVSIISCTQQLHIGYTHSSNHHCICYQLVSVAMAVLCHFTWIVLWFGVGWRCENGTESHGLQIAMVTSAMDPVPFEPMTLTAMTFAALATPYVSDAIVPAQY